MIPAPRRVQIVKIPDRQVIVPPGAVRVDRQTKWRAPFTASHYWIRMLISGRGYVDDAVGRRWAFAQMYAKWIDGTLYEDGIWRFMPPAERRPLLPPPASRDLLALRGRNLADWPPIGEPCVGDVLLARANRFPDGGLFPTASDHFFPRETKSAKRERRRSMNYAAIGGGQ